jgi:hypothetical protein
VSSSDYVSTFRGEGVVPDLVALPVDYASTFRGEECRSATSLPCPRRTTFLRLATSTFGARPRLVVVGRRRLGRNWPGLGFESAPVVVACSENRFESCTATDHYGPDCPPSGRRGGTSEGFVHRPPPADRSKFPRRVSFRRRPLRWLLEDVGEIRAGVSGLAFVGVFSPFCAMRAVRDNDAIRRPAGRQRGVTGADICLLCSRGDRKERW